MFRFFVAYLVYTWGGLHRLFGNKNNLRREHEAAARYFTKAFQIDPTFRRARLDRAVLFWRELGRSKEALADLNAILAEDPLYAPALLNRSMVLQESGRYAESLNDLEAYLQHPPEDEQLYYYAQRTAVWLRALVEDMQKQNEL